LPGHQLLQQAGPEVVLVEGGRAHVVAEAAVPDQVDVGRGLGAADPHLAGEEVGVEVAAFGQAPGDAVLVFLVQGVVEALARARAEAGQVFLQVVVLAAGAGDVDPEVAHLHRLALVDAQGDGDPVLLVADRVDLDAGRVVAERLQRAAGVALGVEQQQLQPRLALFLAQHVVQAQRQAHVLLDRRVLLQAVDLDLAPGPGAVAGGAGRLGRDVEAASAQDTGIAPRRPEGPRTAGREPRGRQWRRWRAAGPPRAAGIRPTGARSRPPRRSGRPGA